MKYDPDKHHRRSIRLKNYDYSQKGAYFVTICTYQKENIFGDVINGEVLLNETGEIVQKIWNELPESYNGIVTDAFQIMPNHVHGIIVIQGVGVDSHVYPKNKRKGQTWGVCPYDFVTDGNPEIQEFDDKTVCGWWKGK